MHADAAAAGIVDVTHTNSREILPTNRTVPVHDFLQKRGIKDVTDPNKQESSKQCLTASASVSSESFNTVKDDASIVKLEPGVTVAPCDSSP